MQPLTVEEAARRAQFVVMRPTELPDGWSVMVHHHPARSRPPGPESVSMSLNDPGIGTRLTIQQTADEIPDGGKRTEVIRHGRQISMRDEPLLPGFRDAKLVIDRTHVWANGSMDESAMLDLLATMVPVEG